MFPPHEALTVKITVRNFVTRENCIATIILTIGTLQIHTRHGVYLAFDNLDNDRIAKQPSDAFPERGARIKIPRPIVCVCRYTSGRVLMRTVRGKEKTCYYPYQPSTQEDSEEHLTPKRFHSRPPSKEDLSPSRCL